jgi:hypothetical protein
MREAVASSIAERAAEARVHLWPLDSLGRKGSHQPGRSRREARPVDETWDIGADDGNTLQVELQFTRGVLARGMAEAKLHSAAKPDFYRIYKFEQAADVVWSTATGIDRVSKFSFKASGPKLAPLFRRLATADRHHLGSVLFPDDLSAGDIERTNSE